MGNLIGCETGEIPYGLPPLVGFKKFFIQKREIGTEVFKYINMIFRFKLRPRISVEV